MARRKPFHRKSQRYTPEEDAWIIDLAIETNYWRDKDYMANKGYWHIGQELGRSGDSIKQRARKLLISAQAFEDESGRWTLPEYDEDTFFDDLPVVDVSARRLRHMGKVR